MINKFAQGTVPVPAELEAEDRELAEAAVTMVSEYSTQMNSFAFNRALQEVWSVISLANKYIVASEPWVLAKEPAKAARMNKVIYWLVESLRVIGLVDVHDQQNLIDHGRWGLIQPGVSIKLGASLFPRLDKINQKPEQAPQPQKAKTSPGERKMTESTVGLITFDEFKNLDLRVAEIKAAEKIEKSDRLLKLTVLAPEERTVVAGIAEFYQPEELVGRQVIMVANLKPAKLMGVASHGMILAARDEHGRLTLSGLADSVTPGSKVS
jgi:methionyl-tRNA synthetase